MNFLENGGYNYLNVIFGGYKITISEFEDYIYPSVFFGDYKMLLFLLVLIFEKIQFATARMYAPVKIIIDAIILFITYFSFPLLGFLFYMCIAYIFVTEVSCSNCLRMVCVPGVRLDRQGTDVCLFSE